MASSRRAERKGARVGIEEIVINSAQILSIWTYPVDQGIARLTSAVGGKCLINCEVDSVMLYFKKMILIYQAVYLALLHNFPLLSVKVSRKESHQLWIFQSACG